LVDDRFQYVLPEMWQEVCRSGKIVNFKITTGSMEPTIRVGDTVKVRHVKLTGIRPGDIAAFRNAENIVVHRIVRVIRSSGSLSFFQMGDQGGISQNVPADSIIGKVIAINRNGREIDVNSMKQIIFSKIFAWRLVIIDSINQRRHYIVTTMLKLFVRPAWRACRNLLLWLFLR
jgi:signal peptidase I